MIVAACLFMQHTNSSFKFFFVPVTKAFATWGKGEGEAMMQFFESQNQLEAIMINLLDEMVRRVCKFMK